MFKYIPGIKVVVPSSVQDAYSLLYASIMDNNPVVFFEHRWLYDVEGELDTELGFTLDDRRVIDGIEQGCGWEIIEKMGGEEALNDHHGLKYECKFPPVPTARHLEDEWYKMRYGKEDIETYEHRFRGPF
jgi:hypothetical protein